MATTAPSGNLKARVGTYFGAHGRFCASHPWEVIVTVVTLTVSVLSMSVLSGGKVGTVCGFNKPCEQKPVDEEVADTVLQSIMNSLAVIYIYNQFSNMRKVGSKYLLAISGLFTVFAGFVFGSGVVNLIDEKVSGLNEALPFFLLLIDLSKASALAKFAFKSRNKDEVHVNIGRGMSMLGPTMTLDTLVEVLLIGIGTISGVRQLEMICCFGCMSLVANYVVFMTFFPAALALVLEVCPSNPDNPSWHLDELARAMQEEEKKPNPVVQRVKMIMAIGLLIVHMHSRFLSGVMGISILGGGGVGEEVMGEGGGGGKSEVEEVVGVNGIGDIEKVPLTEYLLWKFFNMSIDQLVAVVLAILLFIKYIALDKTEKFASSVPPTPANSGTNSNGIVHSSPSPSSSSLSTCPFQFSKPTDSAVARRRAASTGTCTLNLPDITPPQTNGRVNSFEREHLQRVLSQQTRSGSSFSGAGEVGTLALPPADTATSETANLSQAKTPELTKTSELVDLPSPNDIVSDSLPARQPSPLPQTMSVGTQTECVREERSLERVASFSVGEGDSSQSSSGEEEEPQRGDSPRPPRPMEECLAIFRSETGAATLTDDEILRLVEAKHIPSYKLEVALADPERGVTVRRKMISKQLSAQSSLDTLPYTGYHYSLVMGACCENVVGYMPLPVGVAGPLLLDGASYFVPMATTEGCLVASTNRGCRAVASSGGVNSYVLSDGMTRGPVLRLPSAAQASQVKLWLDDRTNFAAVENVFNSTSRFAQLKSLHTALAGRLLYVRFKATTGDAMGMNMISKGVEKSLHFIQSEFPNLEIISLSGNFCTDKKAAAINWLEGRGKSVVCEATVPSQVVTQVLKTSVDALVDLNISKNLIGSAMAGTIGGYNAHAANVVTAIYIATGQDPAQNVASSNCITLIERHGSNGEDLHISCTMPSIEIGTVGGGTILPPQAACLKMLGVHGSHEQVPGENASRLARIVCATVLAGELSLLSALAAGHLVKSHLRHNRSQLNLTAIPEAPQEPSSREHKRTVSLPPGSCTANAS